MYKILAGEDILNHSRAVASTAVLNLNFDLDLSKVLGADAEHPCQISGKSDFRRYVHELPNKYDRSQYLHGGDNKKLSCCWETVRRESMSMPRIAEMDVEMTT